ncbi:hypothetical protein DXG01_005874 [Tephrocybe rancida]|nr:hypothetical protein DXG01_005874 [Tephrocybe rancida]
MPGSRSHNDVSAPGLRAGSRKQIRRCDPLTHAGRHFGRTVYAFGDVRQLVAQGLNRTVEIEKMESQGVSEAVVVENWTARERREFAIYKTLLDMCKGLEERLLESEVVEDLQAIADLVQKGCASARANDSKGLKPAIIDLITPATGSLNPPLNRKLKSTRGFNHEVTGLLLCPAGLDWTNAEIKRKLGSGERIVAGHHWPIFIYLNNVFDPSDPWKGLLRSELLIKAFKHIFIAPSAADPVANDSDAIKSGNAKIHGMHKVTKASIVYVATQVRFALSSASQWSLGDKIMDSENFYTSLLDTLEDPIHKARALDLLNFWDQTIFPHHVPETTLIPVEGSPLERIRQMAIEAQMDP